MKEGLNGKHFPGNNTIAAAVKQWITSAGTDFHNCRMQALVHCCQKHITNGGDCVEKQCFVAENLLNQIVLFCCSHVYLFPWKV